jgi:CheY-like chemotaxis protein
MKIKEPPYKFNAAMLIDDSELDNFINEKTIEANLFAKKVYVHTSAKSALEFLSDLVTMGSEVAAIYPKVLFIDINMPMMDGFQFIEIFKKTLESSLNHPRLVLLTSSVYHEDRQKALEISKDIIFLNKPLTRQMLTDISSRQEA